MGAEEQQEVGGGPGSGDELAAGEATVLCIRGLPQDVRVREMHFLCATFDGFQLCQVQYQSGGATPVAYVQFKSREAAEPVSERLNNLVVPNKGGDDIRLSVSLTTVADMQQQGAQPQQQQQQQHVGNYYQPYGQYPGHQHMDSMSSLQGLQHMGGEVVPGPMQGEMQYHHHHHHPHHPHHHHHHHHHHQQHPQQQQRHPHHPHPHHHHHHHQQQHYGGMSLMDSMQPHHHHHHHHQHHHHHHHHHQQHPQQQQQQPQQYQHRQGGGGGGSVQGGVMGMQQQLSVPAQPQTPLNAALSPNQQPAQIPLASRKTLYVMKIEESWTNERLQDVFAGYGLQKIKRIQDMRKAWLSFDSASGASRALQEVNQPGLRLAPARSEMRG